MCSISWYLNIIHCIFLSGMYFFFMSFGQCFVSVKPVMEALPGLMKHRKTMKPL